MCVWVCLGVCVCVSVSHGDRLRVKCSTELMTYEEEMGRRSNTSGINLPQLSDEE